MPSSSSITNNITSEADNTRGTNPLNGGNISSSVQSGHGGMEVYGNYNPEVHGRKNAISGPSGGMTGQTTGGAGH